MGATDLWVRSGRWVHSLNRLPDPWVDVLFVVDFKDGRHICKGYLTAGRGDDSMPLWWANGHCYHMPQVSYWMPLPELPPC